jgi:hypothetical protein
MLASRKNTTGAQNTTVGAGASACNTTGLNNTAMGQAALETNTTGSCNVAIGRKAMEANTTGGENTMIGLAAGASITTGGTSVGVGRCVLENLTTGNNNIAMGNGSGADAVGNFTNQSNKIAIGNNAHDEALIKIDWTVTSDLRDKTEIADVPYGLDFVNQITPIKYKFKTSRENDTPTGRSRYGFKAQEILELEGDNPILVNNNDEDNLKLTGAYLVPVLVNAIKELKARIEELENE